MDFLYFEPNPNLSSVPDDLTYAFERRPCFNPVTGNGPGDRSGVVICGGAFAQKPHLIGYFPDRQTWLKVPGKDRWIGFYTDDRPTPDELARRTQLQSHKVELAGELWNVPIARAFEASDTGETRFVVKLPRLLGLDDDGQWISGSVVDEYLPLWDVCTRWWNYLATEFESPDVREEFVVTIPTAADDCVTALAVNYRVSKVECTVLGLLRDDTIGEILNAVVDMPSVREIAADKKKESSAPSGGLSLNAGDAD